MFIRRCTYIRGRYDASADFVRLQNFIDGIQEKCGDGNSYFYRIALNFFWILDMFFLLYLLLFVIFFLSIFQHLLIGYIIWLFHRPYFKKSRHELKRIVWIEGLSFYSDKLITFL